MNTLTLALMAYINTHTNIIPLERDDAANGAMFTNEHKEYDVDEDVSYLGAFEHEDNIYDVAVNHRYHLVCLALDGDYDTPENCHYYWVLDPEDVVIENLIEEEDDE